MQRINKVLSKILRTDFSYLFKGTFHLSIGQVFASLSGFFLTIGLVKFLDQAEYGFYSYIFSIVGIASSFTLSGMDVAVTQSIAKGFDRSLVSGFWEKLAWGTPVGVITIAMGGYYLFNGNNILGTSLIVAGLCIPFLSASSLYTSYFNGKRMFRKIASDNALRNIAITVSMLTAAYITKNVLFVIIAYFISSVLISMVRYILLARSLPNLEKNNDRSFIPLGKHLSVMDALALLATHFDKVLVFQYLGATQLALYALALAPIKQLQGISKIVRTLILPKFSTRSVQELKNQMSWKMLVFFSISLSIVIIYCILVPYAVNFFFPNYIEMIIYTQVLSIALLLMPFIFPLQALITHNKKKELYVLNVLKPILKITLLIIFIPLYGIWGAIIAFLATSIVAALLTLLLFKKISD